jgi:putative Mg2+ transporter-C (MgtC) family protein
MPRGGQGIWDVLGEDFSDLPDAAQVVRVTVRLLMAVGLAGALGWQREHLGKAAGLRTHMLVGLGAALFILVPQQMGASSADLSRVIQGLLAGIGFLGAGTILKQTKRQRVHGLTTAAGIWLTAAIGMAAGLGREGTALLGAVLGFVILSALGALEQKLEGGRKPSVLAGASESIHVRKEDKPS